MELIWTSRAQEMKIRVLLEVLSLLGVACEYMEYNSIRIHLCQLDTLYKEKVLRQFREKKIESAIESFGYFILL